MDESKSVVTPEAQRLNAAAACLESGEFDEAELFFKKLTDVDAYRCRAYIGLYCVKLKDKALYKRLTEKFYVNGRNPLDNTTGLDLLKNALKYCDSVDIALNILRYINSGLKTEIMALGSISPDVRVAVIELCRTITEGDVDLKKFNSAEVDDLYLEIAQFQGAAHLQYMQYAAAYSTFCAVLQQKPDHIAAKQMRFYAMIGFSVIDIKNADFTQFSKEEAAEIMKASAADNSDKFFFDNVCSACKRYIAAGCKNVEACDAAFSAMLDLYVGRDERAVTQKIDEYVEALLYQKKFDRAKAYLDKSIELGNDGHQVRWLLLLVKLGVSEDEFVSCKKFSKEMPEYEELIIACGADTAARKSYIAKADANYAFRERKKKEPTTTLELKSEVDKKEPEGFVSLKSVPNVQQTQKPKTNNESKQAPKKQEKNQPDSPKDRNAKTKFVVLVCVVGVLILVGIALGLVALRSVWFVALFIVAGVICFFSIGVFAGDAKNPATPLENKFCNVFFALLAVCVVLVIVTVIRSCAGCVSDSLGCGGCGSCEGNMCDWSGCDDPCSMLFDACTGNGKS